MKIGLFFSQKNRIFNTTGYLISNEKFKLNCIDELKADYKNPIYQCRDMNQVSFLDHLEIFKIFI